MAELHSLYVFMAWCLIIKHRDNFILYLGPQLRIGLRSDLFPLCFLTNIFYVFITPSRIYMLCRSQFPWVYRPNIWWHSDAETWTYCPTSFSLHLLLDQPRNRASVFRDWQNPRKPSSQDNRSVRQYSNTLHSTAFCHTRYHDWWDHYKSFMLGYNFVLKNCNLLSHNVPRSTLQRRRTGRIPHFTWQVVRPAFLLHTSPYTRLSALTCFRVSDDTLHTQSKQLFLPGRIFFPVTNNNAHSIIIYICLRYACWQQRYRW
jgi:hypothetical protein